MLEYLRLRKWIRSILRSMTFLTQQWQRNTRSYSMISCQLLFLRPRAKTIKFSKGKQAGMLAQIPSSAYIFLSAHHLGTDENVASWQEQMDAQCTKSLAGVDKTLRSGLEKQYAVQKELFASKEQVQAECVHIPLYPSRSLMSFP